MSVLDVYTQSEVNWINKWNLDQLTNEYQFSNILIKSLKIAETKYVYTYIVLEIFMHLKQNYNLVSILYYSTRSLGKVITIILLKYKTFLTIYLTLYK